MSDWGLETDTTIRDLRAALDGMTAAYEHERTETHRLRADVAAWRAATADVEAMARVLAPDDWRLHDDPRYDHLPQQARDSLVGKSMRDAQAIRDWLLGNA